jgi:MFS transporter, FHS family, glucose/mannose:H+ symporter
METVSKPTALKLKLIFSYMLISLLICGLSVFVMQGVSYYKISYSSAGSLESYYQLSKIIFLFGIVYIITKIGLKKAFISAIAMIGIYCFLVPSLNSIWAIRGYLILMGIVFATGKIFVYSYVSLVTTTRKEHASFLNLVEGIYMFTGSIGMLLYSYFIKTENWLYIFYIFFIFSGALAALWIFTKVDDSELTNKTEKKSSGLKSFLMLIIMPTVLIFLVMMGMEESVEQGMGSWLPQFNSEVLQLPSFISIQMASILTFSLAVGRIFGAYILKKVSWKPLFLSYLVIAFFMVLFVLLSIKGGEGANVKNIFSAPYISFILPLVGFFIGPMLPTMCSVILTRLPKNKHSIITAIIIIVGAIEVSICSKITGMLFGKFGGIKAFSAVTLIPFAILFFLIILYSFIEKIETKKKVTC